MLLHILSGNKGGWLLLLQVVGEVGKPEQNCLCSIQLLITAYNISQHQCPEIAHVSPAYWARK